MTFLLPPSANVLWVRRKGGRGMSKSAPYLRWLKVSEYAHYDLFKSPLGLKYCWLEIEANMNWKRDLSNILKPMEDFLQKVGEIENDRYVVRIGMSRSAKVPKDMVIMHWGAADEIRCELEESG